MMPCMIIYGKINNEFHVMYKGQIISCLSIYGRIKCFTYVHNKKLLQLLTVAEIVL